ncbi:MAG: exodeoxyribonuclease VII large subunit [Ruminococcaceae bacterium]|nr:exodeoxyribonuclease VII large subunit [Oscillospiraceae bacterium]
MAVRYSVDVTDRATSREAAFTVTQVNEYIKMLLDGNTVLRDVWVKGEISNFTNHYRTGHLYFSLKDEGGLIRAVMFRYAAQKLNFVPEDGMKVLLHGKVSSYVRDGQYQLYAEELVPDGAGSLAVAFEQLKKRLEAEGLFDISRKKTIPKFPRTVGVITSPDGAAVRDIIKVSRRRYPQARILVFPAPVQGERAATYLTGGVKYFNAMKDDPTRGVDVIIIGRGGGSMEDLWSFNDEKLARAIADCEIPVISAVGHEVDFTICDFVADLRAATPSAAAEIAVPDGEELKKRLLYMKNSMLSSVNQKIELEKRRVKSLASSRALEAPTAVYGEWKITVDRLDRAMDAAVRRELDIRRRLLESMAARLHSLSPLSVLTRGYAIAERDDGRVLDSVSCVRQDDKITLRLSDGRLEASVLSVLPDKQERGKI